MVEPDTIIDGRYKVISRVGSGGMADVYLAEDQLLGRQVAVKLLHHHFAEDQEFVERFRREASSAAGLSHQNIVGIFDRGEWERHLLHRDGVRRRPLAEDDRARAGRARPGAGDRHRHADPARRALRAPPRRHPPRPEAAQRDPRRGGPRAGDGLRHRTRGRLGHDADGLDHGHRAVPLAGAGAGLHGQRRLRPLLDRRDPLRAAHRRRCRSTARRRSRSPSSRSRRSRARRARSTRRCRRRWTRSCCARWPRTRRSATPTPTSSSRRSQRERQALPAPRQRGRVAGGAGDHRLRAQRRPSLPIGPAGAPPTARRRPARCCWPTRATTRIAARATAPAIWRALLWGLLAALVVGAIVAAVLLLSSPARQVTVPNVTGETEQAASAQAARGRARARLPSLASSATVASGRVISQIAGGGSRVDERLAREHRRLQRPGQRGADERRRADAGAGGQPPAQGGLQADEQGAGEREGRRRGR